MKDFDSEEIDIIKDGYISKVFYLNFSYNNQGNVINTTIRAYNKDFQNREIKNEDIYTCIWYDDKTLIYSIKGKGLYRYNCITGEKNTILEENRDCEIKKIEDEYLFFDDVKARI